MKVSFTDQDGILLGKIASTVCFTVGTIFLFLAVFVAWKYLFVMGICYLSAVVLYDEKNG